MNCDVMLCVVMQYPEEADVDQLGPIEAEVIRLVHDDDVKLNGL